MSGSVVGRIYNSSSYEDGDVVWTSPISKGRIEENSEIATESGSRYFLAPQSAGEEAAAVTTEKLSEEVSSSPPPSTPPPPKDVEPPPPPPPKEVTEDPPTGNTLPHSSTAVVTPDNLYQVLQGISGVVDDIKKASLGLTAATENISSGDGKKNMRKSQVIDVVLGAQWGDEGKGKLVDMLSQVSVH